jgi:hypothetical protein
MNKLNVLTGEGFVKHKNVFFTDKGYDTLLQYAKSLVKLYHLKQDKDFPFRLGLVFGIPYFGWAHEFRSREELYLRIKSLMQLLMVQELSVDLDGTVVSVGFLED